LKRVCIIALDALEYDLVEEFNLENIKQWEYGKIDVSTFKDLATPVIWASFISGLEPEKHGINIQEIPKWRNPIIDKLRQLSIKIKLDRFKGKGKILRKLGFERRAFYEKAVEEFRNRKIVTLFSIIPNARALSVPPYQKWIDRETQLLLRDAVEKEERRSIFEEHVWNIFELKRKECLNIISEGRWNLFMVHFMFTDLLGHVYAGDLTKMFGVYIKADQLVEEIKKIIKDETLLLVVSDHGMKTFGKGTYGEHSNHGFYSSNVQLNLTNPKITDFFDLIVKTLTAHTKHP
jgi:hypothetical protein